MIFLSVAARRYGAVIAFAVVAAIATAVISSTPGVRFAYRAPELHVALESAASLIALLATHLVLERFRRSRRLDDLVLAVGFGLTALSNLAFTAIPAAVGVDAGDPFPSWAAVISRLLGALVFSAAAFTPSVQLRRVRACATIALVGCAVALALIGGLVAAFASRLPLGVELDLAASASWPEISGHPLLLVAQVVTMVALGLAAVGFARRFARTGDDLMRWVALSAIAGSFARLNYFLYPSLYSEWVYTGDVFRTLGYVALLIGAAREIDRYWRGMAEAAALEERRRVARDLHDGLAQELAFIVRATRRPDVTRSAEIAAAAERALEETRYAVAALARPFDEPLAESLKRAVAGVAMRYDTNVEVEASGEIEREPRQRDALLRIACEAVANAARHGAAQTIRVDLCDEDGIRLQVQDDGVGFDPEGCAREPTGFGLVTMSERAKAVGGSLRIRSRPGAGTTVQVVIP